MGGKTSAASKYKYNSRAYDRIALSVPKGKREAIQQHAQQQGKSTNQYITDLIDSDMQSNEK